MRYFSAEPKEKRQLAGEKDGASAAEYSGRQLKHTCIASTLTINLPEQALTTKKKTAATWEKV